MLTKITIVTTIAVFIREIVAFTFLKIMYQNVQGFTITKFSQLKEQGMHREATVVTDDSSSCVVTSGGCGIPSRPRGIQPLLGEQEVKGSTLTAAKRGASRASTYWQWTNVAIVVSNVCGRSSGSQLQISAKAGALSSTRKDLCPHRVRIALQGLDSQLHAAAAQGEGVELYAREVGGLHPHGVWRLLQFAGAWHEGTRRVLHEAGRELLWQHSWLWLHRAAYIF